MSNKSVNRISLLRRYLPRYLPNCVQAVYRRRTGCKRAWVTLMRLWRL